MKSTYFFNTLSRQKEEFKPLHVLRPSGLKPLRVLPSNEVKPPEERKVKIYTCGPTVYSQVHIGNLRAMLFYDLIKRVLLFNGYEVNHVMNITDVDDKTIRDSQKEGLSLPEFTEKYTTLFFEDLKKLNILEATTFPRATQYIPQMIQMIQVLVDKGIAYGADGSVYFDISKFPNYGQLARLDLEHLKTGTRVDVDEYSRDSVNDFVLWKKAKEGEPSWDSPWGQGRPGWHIECSAMAKTLLGETLDIHGAGVDLVFPHNEDEIAQSEAANGAKFVNYWLHNEHLLVDNTKMSKSLGNVYTLAEVEAKKINPLAFRYLVLTAKYRDKLNFTWESLQAAQSALENLYTAVSEMAEPKIGCAGYEDDFLTAINDDLDTPTALALMWKLIKSPDEPGSAKLATIYRFDQVLGLDIETERQRRLDIPTEAKKLLEKRQAAREAKDFATSDQLREELAQMGVEVKDTPEGQKWSLHRHSER